MENIERAIACFDKKLTDYQIYVDRELQEQKRLIKQNENYLINTLNSQNKKIDNSIIALGLKETATGKTIALNDVLDIKHKCLCKLTSDTYKEDVGGSSKNIYQFKEANMVITARNSGEQIIGTYTVNDNGTITYTGKATVECRTGIDIALDNLNVGTTYTFSIRDGNGNAVVNYFATEIMYMNGDIIPGNELYPAADGSLTIKIGDYTTYRIWVDLAKSDEGTEYENVTFYPMLEYGSTMSEWEEYGGKKVEKSYIEDFSTVQVIVTNDNGSVEYTPDTNGIVEVDSFAPNMTIETSNEHCNIEFVYYIEPKKYIDKKIAEMVGV